MGPIALVLVSLIGCSNDVQKVDRLERGLRVLGTLKEGKKHGQWLTLSPEGKPWFLETWRNGYQHGLSRWWYDNGAVMSDSMYRADVPHGRDRMFHDTGQIASLGWRHKGRPIGLWCEWDEHGKLEKISEYFDGRLVREEAEPAGGCPLLAGAGQRHLDPADGDYE